MNGRVACVNSRGLVAVMVMMYVSSLANARAVLPLDVAESLYVAGCFNEAISEYKRHLFFFPESENASYIYHQLGLSYRNLGDWDGAASMLRTAIDRQENDSLRAEFYIDLAVANIASGNYSAAELRLTKLTSFAQQQSVRRDACFFLMVSNIYQGKWKKCRALLDSTIFFDEPQVQATVSALLERESHKRKSPDKAKWLSTFVPGLGQLYAGHFLAAAKAMAINGLVGANLYQQLSSGGRVFDITLLLFTFKRYWSGNRDRAAYLVREDKSKEDSLFRQELLDTLSALLR